MLRRILSDIIFLSLIGVAVALQAATAAAQPIGTRITAVEIRGNDRVEEGSVVGILKSKPGEPFDPKTVNEDVKALYRSAYFDQVTAKSDTTSGLRLVFQVVEKPAIRTVNLVGNKEVSDDTIKEKMNLTSRRFLDRKKLQAGVDELKAYYQDQGYYGTEIKMSETAVEENQVDVTLNVTEGEKKVIDDIRFEGNQDLSSGDLYDQIETRTWRWYISWLTGSGVVKKDMLANDGKRLAAYYLNHGYVDIQIAEPEVSEGDDGLIVTFKLKEGAIYRLGKISAEGTLVESSVDKTLADTESKTGEIFSAERLQKDSFKITEKYTDVGYAYANVDPLTKVNRDQRTVDIDYRVDRGKLITINEINITGNSKTRDNVIRRSLQITEQEQYSSSKIKRSQELLQRLGFFDEVTITQSSTSRDDMVDLLVSVREANTGTFSIGAGVSSGDGFIFSTRISENNIFGTGNAVTLDLENGTRRENYVLGFTNPRVNDSYWSFGADGSVVKRRYDDFDLDKTGASMTVGYPILRFLGPEYLDDVRGSLSYEFASNDINNIDDNAAQLVKDSEGSATNSSLTPKITRDTINNPLDPTTGSRQIVSFEYAGIGGDAEYYLIQASNTWYYPLWDSPIGTIVFSNRLRVGYGDSTNNDPFPLFRRFFPGGINSVRGYDARSMGPRDENGNEYGGAKQAIANFEMIFPLISSAGLNFVTFYDTGEAFDDDESIDISQFRGAYGFGLRWRSPLAPIRIEFGFPTDKEEGDKSFVTNFSFGSPL